MSVFIFPIRSISWQIGIPVIVAIVGGIILKTKLAARRSR
jgi:hypothetical protein